MSRILCIVMALAILLPNARAGQGQVVASDPWIREAPPGVSMWAGFVSLKNTSSRPVALVRAESPAFHMVELHRSMVENGVVRMREQHRIEIAPGASLALQPGGYHLMLMHAQQPVQAGKSLPVTLLFDNGQKLELNFSVRRGE